MTTICGHERGVLIWACTELSELPFYIVSVAAETLGNGRREAVDALHDPAKLAELLAHEGRRLGMRTALYSLANLDRYDNDVLLRVDGSHIVITTWRTVLFVEMPIARSLLAAWLTLEDGDSEGAEQALRGAT